MDGVDALPPYHPLLLSLFDFISQDRHVPLSKSKTSGIIEKVNYELHAGVIDIAIERLCVSCKIVPTYSNLSPPQGAS